MSDVILSKYSTSSSSILKSVLYGQLLCTYVVATAKTPNSTYCSILSKGADNHHMFK